MRWIDANNFDGCSRVEEYYVVYMNIMISLSPSPHIENRINIAAQGVACVVLEIVWYYYILFSRIIFSWCCLVKEQSKVPERSWRRKGKTVFGIRCVIVVVSQICERIRRNRLTIIFKVPQAKDMKHNRYKITYFNMNWNGFFFLFFFSFLKLNIYEITFFILSVELL